MKNFVNLVLCLIYLLQINTAKAQGLFNPTDSQQGNKPKQEEPVKWSLSSKQLNDCEFELIFKGDIDEHWHVYALNLPSNEGPLPSSITFEKNDDYILIGKPTEGKPVKAHDPVFDVDVAYFENKILFKQKVKLVGKQKVTVSGTYEYQACIDDKCIFPPATPFTFELKSIQPCEVNKTQAETAPSSSKEEALKKEEKNASKEILEEENNTLKSLKADSVEEIDANTEERHTQITNGAIQHNMDSLNDESTSIHGKPWWIILLTGFIWGFAALFTPCVFPLIPMNVSFFLKTSKNKAKGKINALIYALSIIIIFVSLGLGITTVFGGGALNSLATSAGFNGFIFILLLIFAASFLGAFEITLPSGLVNKIDKQSDRGGYAGIFFMALTLVVVSFSCTGPMVGNALFAAANSGNTSGAFWAMLGFSSGLALPFGFFAFFPSFLNTVPKSGGWLNNVKVVLGFLELALALKFASNIDLVYQLEIITREVFITIWVVIFSLITIYLLGGFKTAHDSETPYLSVTRLSFVILSFSMTIYILPGLWGAPLKLLSGILPPLEYSESPHGFGQSAKHNSSAAFESIDAEYREHIEINKHGIVHFKNDYENALAYAQKINKPLLIDFTGRACANCRKTEDYIWPDQKVKNILNNDVVLVSLYVDEKRELDTKDFQTVFWYGKKREIKTIGDKYKYMEESRYKQISQPLYVMVDNNEQLLVEPRGYESGINEYVNWLNKGIESFKTQK